MSAITFSGLASGIDSSSLIKSLLDQEKKLKISPLEKEIESITSRNDALSQLNDLLNSVKEKASLFRVLNGGALKKNSSSSDDSVITASASNSASRGVYSLSVSQLAKNATFTLASSSTQYTASSDKISAGAAFSDNISITIGDPLSPVDVVSIAIDQNTSLSDFVSEFNSETSSASASLVNVGTSSAADYRIVINTNKTGESEGQIDVNVGAGITARSAFDQNQADYAKNAVFNMAGIGNNIERQSNTINDVIDGLSFNLLDTGSATLSVNTDSEKSSSALKDLISDVNKLFKFISENDAVSQSKNGNETINIFGPLSETSIDDNFLTSFRSSMSSSSLTGGLVNTFADFGITTERDGTLKFDEETFMDAINSDSQSVGTILENFAENIASTDGLIAQHTRFNGLIDQSETSNTQKIDSLYQRISDTESQLQKYEENLLKRFSALEVITGKLQSAQTALAGLPA